MENASKALIIAGAILLSILIISLGIMVYNNAKSTVGDANLDSETIQTFNSKFTMYTGSGISAAKANSLIEAVNANNATGDDKIAISFDSSITNTDYTGTYTPPTVSEANGVTSVSLYGSCTATLSNTNTYDISYGQSTSGMINLIKIKKHS